MKMKKRFLAMLFALGMACSVTACSSKDAPAETNSAEAASAEEAIVLKIGVEGSKDSNDNKVAMKIKELVEADETANIEVQVFGDAQLGSLRDLIEGLSLNTVGMTLGGNNGFENICPNMGVFSPWMVGSPEAAIRLWESETGKQLQEQLLNDNNIRMMSWCNCISGTTYFWGNKPYTTLADYKGVNIRSNNSGANIKALGAFGANPVIMGFADVYNGIETGLIDMTWGSIPVVINGGLGEVLDYVMPAPANFTSGSCAMSEMLWQKMSEYQQKVLQDAVIEACQVYGNQLHEEDLETADALLEGAGVEYVEMNAEDYQTMCDMVTDTMASYLGETCEPAVLEAAKTILAE